LCKCAVFTVMAHSITVCTKSFCMNFSISELYDLVEMLYIVQLYIHDTSYFKLC